MAVSLIGSGTRPTGRTRSRLTAASEAAYTLAEHGIRAVEIGPEGPRGDEGIHIGTMFRFKGLEYKRMIIAGISDGLVPREAVNRLRSSDPVRYRRELQRARSLLFVATTRTRDSLDIFWHGAPVRSRNHYSSTADRPRPGEEPRFRRAEEGGRDVARGD